MSLLLLAPDRDMTIWKDALREADPNLEVEIWPEVANRERVQCIVSWNHPKQVLNRFPNLKVISSLGAGVDHILNDGTLPESVAVCRVVSPSLVRQMQEYVLTAVLNYQRNMFAYFRQREANTWKAYPNNKPGNIPVGVMGLGKLGRPVAEILVTNGYTVNGWSQTEKVIPGVRSFASARLDRFLGATRILVCLLPLTDETEHIMDLDLFKQLIRPAFVINVGRGEHLVDEDLVYAMDKGWVDGACLDVFTEEPLPERHPFWNRKEIMITPHAASLTPPGEVAEQIVENYKRALSGMPLIDRVDRIKGY